MNWTVLILVLVIGGGFFYVVFGIFSKNQLRFYRDRKHSELDEIITELGVEIMAIEFFTDGHPYYWVGSDIEEVRKGIDRSCFGPSTVAVESSLVLVCDHDTKRIYVFSKWNSNVARKLKHFEPQ